MKKRIISSLTLWGILFALLYFFQIHGGILIMLYLSGAAQLELYKIWEKSGRRVAPKAGTVAGTFLILAAYYLDGYVSNLVSDPWSRIAILAVCSVLFAWILFLVFPPKTRFPGEALIPTSLGILYLPFLLQFFLQIQLLEDGQGGLFICLWVVVATKFTDMGALLFGKYLGKHKMAPTLSPNKTWEGAIGGVLVSVIGAYLVGLLGNQLDLGFKFSLPTIALLAIPLSIIGQIGDLLESAFKRQANVKDSGQGIPGIGGALDLVDSLILAAPLAYVLVTQFDIFQR